MERSGGVGGGGCSSYDVEGGSDSETIISTSPQHDSNSNDDANNQHPARRPMNAFLLFCKKHRKQVRDKYPHLENRQVTKILGEWWADLGANEKAGYQELAKQLKEAFLRANPDFKWYKVPTQPPRPPPARPSNQKVPRHQSHPTTNSGITFGKLADENLMGKLSHLWSPPSSSSGNTSSDSLLLPPSSHHLDHYAHHPDYEYKSEPCDKLEDSSSVVNFKEESLNFASDISDHQQHPYSRHEVLPPPPHTSSYSVVGPPYLLPHSPPLPPTTSNYQEESHHQHLLRARSPSSHPPQDNKNTTQDKTYTSNHVNTSLKLNTGNAKLSTSSDSQTSTSVSTTVLRVPSFTSTGTRKSNRDSEAIADKEDIAVNVLSALATSVVVVSTGPSTDSLVIATRPPSSVTHQQSTSPLHNANGSTHTTNSYSSSVLSSTSPVDLNYPNINTRSNNNNNNINNMDIAAAKKVVGSSTDVTRRQSNTPTTVVTSLNVTTTTPAANTPAFKVNNNNNNEDGHNRNNDDDLNTVTTTVAAALPPKSIQVSTMTPPHMPFKKRYLRAPTSPPLPPPPRPPPPQVTTDTVNSQNFSNSSNSHKSKPEVKHWKKPQAFMQQQAMAAASESAGASQQHCPSPLSSPVTTSPPSDTHPSSYPPAYSITPDQQPLNLTSSPQSSPSLSPHLRTSSASSSSSSSPTPVHSHPMPPSSPSSMHHLPPHLYHQHGPSNHINALPPSASSAPVNEEQKHPLNLKVEVQVHKQESIINLMVTKMLKDPSFSPTSYVADESTPSNMNEVLSTIPSVNQNNIPQVRSVVAAPVSQQSNTNMLRAPHSLDHTNTSIVVPMATSSPKLVHSATNHKSTSQVKTYSHHSNKSSPPRVNKNNNTPGSKVKTYESRGRGSNAGVRRAGAATLPLHESRSATSSPVLLNNSSPALRRSSPHTRALDCSTTQAGENNNSMLSVSAITEQVLSGYSDTGSSKSSPSPPPLQVTHKNELRRVMSSSNKVRGQHSVTVTNSSTDILLRAPLNPSIDLSLAPAGAANRPSPPVIPQPEVSISIKSRPVSREEASLAAAHGSSLIIPSAPQSASMPAPASVTIANGPSSTRLSSCVDLSHTGSAATITPVSGDQQKQAHLPPPADSLVQNSAMRVTPTNDPQDNSNNKALKKQSLGKKNIKSKAATTTTSSNLLNLDKSSSPAAAEKKNGSKEQTQPAKTNNDHPTASKPGEKASEEKENQAEGAPAPVEEGLRDELRDEDMHMIIEGVLQQTIDKDEELRGYELFKRTNRAVIGRKKASSSSSDVALVLAGTPPPTAASSPGPPSSQPSPASGPPSAADVTSHSKPHLSNNSNNSEVQLNDKNVAIDPGTFIQPSKLREQSSEVLLIGSDSSNIMKNTSTMNVSREPPALSTPSDGGERQAGADEDIERRSDCSSSSSNNSSRTISPSFSAQESNSSRSFADKTGYEGSNTRLLETGAERRIVAELPKKRKSEARRDVGSPKRSRGRSHAIYNEAGRGATRKCKGKKYKKLIEEGVLIQPGRRTKTLARSAVNRPEDFMDDSSPPPHSSSYRGGAIKRKASHLSYDQFEDGMMVTSNDGQNSPEDSCDDLMDEDDDDDGAVEVSSKCLADVTRRARQYPASSSTGDTSTASNRSSNGATSEPSASSTEAPQQHSSTAPHPPQSRPAPAASKRGAAASSSSSATPPAKHYQPDNFDLEAKIKALPDLSLDEFTLRKKEMKKKQQQTKGGVGEGSKDVSSMETEDATQKRVEVPSSRSHHHLHHHHHHYLQRSSPPVTADPKTSSFSSAPHHHSSGVRGGRYGGGARSPDGGAPAVSSRPQSSSSSSYFGEVIKMDGGEGSICVGGGGGSDVMNTSGSDGSFSGGEDGGGGAAGGDGGQKREGSQKRKARKEDITRHDPQNSANRSVVDTVMFSSIGLRTLADAALQQAATMKT